MATNVLDSVHFKESTAHGIVFAVFWAPWCSPCRAFFPTVEKVAENNPDIAFAKINIEELPELAMEHNIQAIPTLLAFREGVLVHRQSGAQPAHSLQRIVDGVRADEPPRYEIPVSSQRADAA